MCGQKMTNIQHR